jgi:diguanylate cyclase (GGDEF)-like protein
MPELTSHDDQPYSSVEEPILELIRKQEKYQRRITELEQQLEGFENENRLLYRIAACHSLDDVFELILSYLRLKWGVDALGVQFVDLQSSQLVSSRLVGFPEFSNPDVSRFNARIDLDPNVSISAKVALTMHAFYASEQVAEQVEQMQEVDRWVIQHFKIRENLIVPVIDDGRSLAVLHLFSFDHAMNLSEDDIAEIQSFLLNIATHIKREHQRQEFERFKKEQASILSLSHQIASAHDLVGLLEVLGEHVLAYGEFDGYMINLYQSETDALVCEKICLPGELSAVESTYLKMKFPMQVKDINIEVFRSGERQSFSRASIEGHHDTTRTRFDRWELSSLVVLPVTDSCGSVLGTIMLFRQEGQILPSAVEDLQQKLVLFVTQMKRAQSLSVLQSKAVDIELAVVRINRLMTILNRISRLISPDEICKCILEEIMSFFGLDLGVLFLKHDTQLIAEHTHVTHARFSSSCQRFLHWVKQTPYPIQYEAGSLASAMLNNTHFYFSDIKSILDLPMSELDREGSDLLSSACSLIIMPVRIGHEPIGVMWLYNLEKHSRYSDEEINLISQISTFAGAAISNAELYEKVETQKRMIEGLNTELEKHNKQLAELARKDRLTGLFNFGYFQEELSRRLNENSRSTAGSRLSLVLIDIDHFKAFNDNYGHVSGNVALVQIATILRKYARRMDIVCRYGGEEFAVILPKCESEGAVLFAERLREAVAASPVQIENQAESITVTISIGCGTHIPGESSGDFVVRTDEALYRAKELGRNRVETAATQINQEFKLKSNKFDAFTEDEG